MEDPFSILSILVPEPPSRPHLTPLYPPSSSVNTSQPQPTSAPSPFPVPVALPLPLSQPTPKLSTLPDVAITPNSATPIPKRRHWTITRNAPLRSRVKDRDDDDFNYSPAWKVPREAHAADFGSLGVLAGALAEEMKLRGLDANGSRNGSISAGVRGDAELDGLQTEEELLFDAIRSSVNCEDLVAKRVYEADATSALSLGVTTSANMKLDKEEDVYGYWTPQRAAEAEDYVRDVVYGGVGGLAYVRSLAEFVHVDRTSQVRISRLLPNLSLVLSVVLFSPLSPKILSKIQVQVQAQALSH